MKYNKVHFIGIGGIGVSALAQYYLSKEAEVSGSDLFSSEITDFLKEKGAKIFIGKHKKQNLLSNIDLVIYSPAVKKDNPELRELIKQGAKAQSYPEALGDLTKQYFAIAVSGTHGKSTTTAMIALVLTKAGLDPTVIIGTKIREFGNHALSPAEGTNFRAGKSKILVIEADEHFASFLNYWPKIIVLTNIEREHLDYYKNLKNILKTYRKYIGHLPKDGVLIYNKDDINISKLKAQNVKLQFKAQNYTIKQKEAKKLKKMLKIPGQHNVYNALAALTVARFLAIPDKITFKALSEYRGSWRRFEIKSSKVDGKKITIISDYGHHPTEVLATLKAVREKYLYPPKFSKGKLRRARKKIWCIFQPHQYQRTYYLFNDFVKVFRKAPIDNIIITDIYDVAGRETPKINIKVSSKLLVEKIYPAKSRKAGISPRAKLFNRVNRKNIIYLPLCDIKKHIKNNIKSGDILIIMGAGDIYKFADELSLV